MTQLSFFNAFVLIGQLVCVDTVCFCAFIIALSFVLTPLLRILLGTTHWKMGVLIQSNTVRTKSDQIPYTNSSQRTELRWSHS